MTSIEDAPRTSQNIRSYKKKDLDLTKIQVLMSEGKCKICSNPERTQADILIYRMKMRDVTDHGTAFTRKYLLAALEELGIPSPNLTNIKTHWGKHTAIASEELVKAQEESMNAILGKLTGAEILSMSRQDLLDTMMRQGVAEAGARLRHTGKSGITVDQVLKIAELQIREKGSEAQNEFLKALGGGIVAAVKNGIPQKQAKLLADAEVVDADVVEIEEPENVAA